MVEISEIVEDDPQPTPAAAADAAEDNAAESRSEERLSDADEIECAMDHITRRSARLHLENLITKLRKEGKALQRVAASKAAASSSSSVGDGASGDDNANDGEPIPQAAPARPKEAPIPKRAPAAAPVLSSNKYQSFPTYYFDSGKYDSAAVSVYLPLEGIGTHDRSKITCHFTPSSFDLVVTDYNGKSYRLLNNNLEKDIDTSKSKHVVKPNKIIIKLGKVKGEYGYDSWTQLTAKKTKKKDSSGRAAKEDPTAGIMDMMKDMYDEGDDNMKKMIGETMMKQRNGQMGGGGGGMDDPMGMMGGMGGMGGMGDMMGGMGGMGL